MPASTRSKPAPASGHPRRRTSGGRSLGIYLAVAAGAVVIVAVIAVVALSGQNGPTTDQGGAGGTPPGEKLAAEDGVHIAQGQHGKWATDPPASGQHYPAPAQWGVSSTPLPPETWVHNLEHGGIAILYNCAAGCPDDLAKIRDFIRSAPKETQFGEVKIVDAPYPVPGHRFAIMAWGWRLFMDIWDPNPARRFYLAHVDRAPEALP